MRHRQGFYLTLSLIIFLAVVKSSAKDEQSLFSILEPGSGNVSLNEKITCSPRKLYRGETLVITMPVPHGGDLAIVGPNKSFSFIVYYQPDKKSKQQPLINRETFETMAQLKLATDQAREMMWADDEKPSRLIFTRTGWYEVWLSANLETDDGTPVAKCRVYYVNKRKP
jgi:hypothetical protein